MEEHHPEAKVGYLVQDGKGMCFKKNKNVSNMRQFTLRTSRLKKTSWPNGYNRAQQFPTITGRIFSARNTD